MVVASTWTARLNANAMTATCFPARACLALTSMNAWKILLSASEEDVETQKADMFANANQVTF